MRREKNVLINGKTTKKDLIQGKNYLMKYWRKKDIDIEYDKRGDPILQVEFFRALIDLNNNKARGTDEISPELLHSLDEVGLIIV